MKPDASAIAHELNQTCAMLVETPAGLSVELNQPKATAIIQRALDAAQQEAATLRVQMEGLEEALRYARLRIVGLDKGYKKISKDPNLGSYETLAIIDKALAGQAAQMEVG